MKSTECSYYIDKTEYLEEGLKRYPSIYIEGNAAVGKTVAVKMLREKHPEVTESVYQMEWELREPQEFLLKLQKEQKRMEERMHWLILDKIPADLDGEIADRLAEMVQRIQNDSKVLFISREKPQMEFLRLLWEGNMELITMEQLLFSVEEVRRFVEKTNSGWNAKVLFEKTGGWAGCVSMLVRLEKKQMDSQKASRMPILQNYEVKDYIERELLAALSAEETGLLRQIAGCPWVTEEFCEEVWGSEDASKLLEGLCRKGMLVYERTQKHWKTNGLFRSYVEPVPLKPGLENAWYEEHGFLQEAFWCLEKINDLDEYHACMLRNYRRAASVGAITSKILNWNSKDVRDIYFRGVYDYQMQEFDELEKEITWLKKLKEQNHQVKEIILNLSYLNPGISLEKWLLQLEEYTKDGTRFCLYHILGRGATCLCGIRDLSGLFIGGKKDVRRMERLWKQSFGEYEWKCYQLARIDFYLETAQKDAIEEEDWMLLRADDVDAPWQLRLAKLYLLCKLQREAPDEERGSRIWTLENVLMNENPGNCAKNAEAISSLYAPWYGHKEKLVGWLRDISLDATLTLNDDNYLQCYCAAKGYLLLNQYDRAEKLLEKLIPFLQQYHRNRLMAESLFQQGIVFWKKELKGKAIRSVIEAFLICGNSRYVGFFASYGQRGCPLLEAYIEWQHANAPEGWNRKKKYNYGNVHKMPMQDYIQAVLRSAKKVSRSDQHLPEEYIEEQLTMMETLVLQNIGRGMSNAQICDALGLKLPTVKGHAYSLYKKLGVESRTQAVRKGKELGIIE